MNLNYSHQYPCPVILDSKCVIYEGENLLYIGVNTNDSYRTALQNINTAIGNLILSGGITQLRGDVIAYGPGNASATLATVNTTTGTFGSSTAIPKITVNGKGLVTHIETETVFIPSGSLNFIGDATGTGNTGSDTTFTLKTVNSNVYTNNTFLKFRVNGKGLVTSATPVISGDIVTALGYTPYNSTNPLGFISGITSSMVTNALGYTPYSNTNPSGFISGINSSDVTTALGFTPYNSTNPNAFIPLTALSASSPLSYNSATGIFTIQPANASQNGYLSLSDWSTFNAKQSALSGTGFIKISGTTISYDNTTYYPVSNPSSFISGITGTMVTTALGYTPYNNTNPSNFISRLGLSASAPLFYDNVNGAFTIQEADATHDGYLSSDDWNTFNNKQVSGNYITDLNGEVSGTGPGVANVTLNNSAVTGKVLTGVNVTGGNITDTDSILIAFGKLQNQINSLIGSSIYKGTWNAATNNPTLTSGIGTRGWYYITNVYGTTNLDGNAEWHVGDWVIFDGTVWQKVDTTDAVVSVNGFDGAVSLTTDNVPEGSTNHYFTTVRARTSVSAGTGLSYNDNTGVFSSTITQYTDALARTALSAGSGITYNNTAGTISNSAPDQIVTIGSGTGINVTGTYPNFTVANTITQYTNTLARAAISGGTGISYNSTTGVITNTITQYTDALARASISAGTGISYSSSTGVISSTITQYTDALARASLSFTAGSGAYNSTTGVITIPTNNNQITNGAAYITLTNLSAGTGISYNNTTGVITSTITQYTDALARAAISLTTSGNSGSSTYSSSTGVLNVPTYTLAGLGGISLTSLSATTPLSYNSITGVFSIQAADSTHNGYLSSTDWNTFNNKQSALTFGNVTGSDFSITGGTGAVVGSGLSLALAIVNSNTYATNTFLKFSVNNKGLVTSASVVGSADIISALGYTPYNSTNPSNYISLGALSATSPLSYNSLTGAFSISQSTTSSNGYLSSTDWNTFNNKQNALGYTPVPNTRNLTINGTTYDLSADRSWTIAGGVTSFNTRTGAITLTSGDVTTALGYTPYNSTNPSGYTSNTGTVTSISGTGTVSGLTLTGSVTSSGSLTLGGTLSLTSANVTTALGFTPYNATNPSGYITGITSTNVTTALGYTPYNSTNPSGYITGITSSNVTNALGYTPYNATNPSGYITSSGSISGNAATATNATNTIYMNTQFQGSGSVNTSEGRCMSLRTDSGAGAAVNYAPVLHMAASDTMWQAQGTYGGSGNGTLYFRQGYAGSWGNWLTMISSANIGSQSVNYANSAGTATDSTKIPLSGGTTSGVVDFGPNSGNNNGIGIMYGSSGYGRIRFYQDSYNNHSTIHSFGNNWGGGYSNGCINVNGSLGVTLGAWNDPDMKVNIGGHTYAKGYRGNANVGGTGEATWHPAGIYCGGTMWQYGTQYRNGNTTSGQGWLYLDWDYGISTVGVYSASRYQGVWSMGDAYRLSADGTSTGNLYGLAWSHPNAGGQAGYLTNHGLIHMMYGTAFATISDNIWCRNNITAYSDIRVKENIEVIPNAMEKINAIRGVTFTRNDVPDTTKRHAGVIAQEIQKVLPEVITENTSNGHLSVAYGNINALTIEGLKEHDVKIKKQNELIDFLLQQVSELKEVINVLTK